MCDPPKSNVTSSTLTRLLGPLADCDRKRVTVIFHILPPDRTAFMAEQNRQRAANQVDAATHAVEGAAGSARIDLRPCYGAQDSAFAASLPLGLNLRNYTPPSVFNQLS